MKRNKLFLLLAGIAAGMLLGVLIVWSGSRLLQLNSGRQPSAKTGSPAPEFALTDLDGKTVQLADFRGKAVIINFWASWCGPCRKEMPLLERQHQDWSGELVVLGINVGENQEIARQFGIETGITFPLLLAGDSLVNADYGVNGFPTTYFVDQEGILKSIKIGELNEAMLAQHLETIGIQP